MSAVSNRAEKTAAAERTRGVDLVFPEDWMSALKLRPHQISEAEVDDVVAAVTPKMIEKSCLIGTPDEVSSQLIPFVAAGATGTGCSTFNRNRHGANARLSF